jgi:hypothetical protein
VVGLDETAVLIAILGGFVVGGLIGFAGLDEIEEWNSSEKRDALMGWTAFFAFVLVLGALFGIPMPWGALAAVAIVAATVAVLRRVPGIG